MIVPGYTPYITPEPGEVYRCETCFDYGGLLDLNPPYPSEPGDGIVCPTCYPPKGDHELS